MTQNLSIDLTCVKYPRFSADRIGYTREMDVPPESAALVNSVLNAVNLALTAWVIQTTRDTKRDVRRNTRITRRGASAATEVKEKTNGVLEALLNRLEDAARRIAEAEKLRTSRRSRLRKKRKPPGRKPK